MNLICRLCASALPDMAISFSIYSSADLKSNKSFTQEESLRYLDLICMITNNFDILKFNGISDQMCEVCASNLKQFHVFKMQIEKANDIFADMLNNLELKPNIEINSECTINEEIVDNSDSQDFSNEEKLFDNLNESTSSDIVKTQVLTGHKTIAIDKKTTDNKKILKDKTIANVKDDEIIDSSAVKILPSKFTTNTKQLPPEEQAKWQKKLEFWIKNQTKQDAPHNQHKYICENCGKIYSSKYALKQHEYVHTGIMKFECTECGRKFGQKKLMNAHMQIKHIKTKFFTCTKCGRVFNRSSTLAKHRWVHEDIRPFKCEYCEKTFKWKTCYKFHLNTHTKAITYNCYLCDKVYESRSSRRKHCLKFHDGLGRAPLESTPIVNRPSSNLVK